MHGFDSEHPDAYATATSGEPRCSDGKIHGMPIAADTQFWNLLSEVDPDPVRKNVSMEFAMRPAAEGGLITEDQDIIGGGARLTGALWAPLESDLGVVSSMAMFQGPDGRSTR